MNAIRSKLQRVLVLDEDAPSAIVITKALACHGYPVAHETSPGKAIRSILDERFDFLLSEYQLRGLDGFQVARILRTMGSMVPVILRADAPAEFCADDLALLGILGVVPKSLEGEKFSCAFSALATLAAN